MTPDSLSADEQMAIRNAAMETLNAALDPHDVDVPSDADVDEVMGGYWVHCRIWIPDGK